MFRWTGRLLILLATLAVPACAMGSRDGARVPAPGEGVRRAALATITVENRTAERLWIAFHAPGTPERTIGVGVVPPLETASVAPVLAGEPIVLSARNEAGAVYRLPPRTFEVDQEWIWVIPPDAAFADPGPGGRPGPGRPLEGTP